MTLHIVCPSYNKKVDITWLELNTDIGNFVIQSGHAPTVLMLSKNKKVTYCLTTGKQETLEIAQGIVDIERTQATLIISESSNK